MKKIFICAEGIKYDKILKIEDMLKQQEYRIINPIMPILNTVRSPYEWVNHNLLTIATCQSIYMADGWERYNTSRLYCLYAEVMDKEIVYQTPPTEKTEEREYLWHLCGHRDKYSYLNVVDGQIKISSPIESGACKTHFTAVEYLTIAEEHGFDSTSFVREEIE